MAHRGRRPRRRDLTPTEVDELRGRFRKHGPVAGASSAPAPATAAPTAAPPAAPVAPPGLSPEDVQFFQSGKRRTRELAALGLARNQFERDQLGLSRQRSTADLNRRFAALRERLPGAFAQRGLLNSGLYQRGLADYAQERSAAFDRLGLDYQRQLGALGLSDLQLNQVMTQTLSDLEEQEAARLEAVAAALQPVYR